MGSGDGEFTVECNPETVTPELMEILVQGGVNRVSMGAQSFNPVHLKTLERWHDPASVPRALSIARDAGISRRSIDLIFGIPGQTLDDWKSDLDAALALGTTHLSCYNLTYEPNTAMTARKNRGEFAAADEDLEVEMYSATLAALRAAGLERYEVSNYARPGDEARHNLAYWHQEQWLAAGPSASAHVAGHRWKNLPRLDDYLSFSDEGFAAITDHEPPDAQRALAERIMTGLRLARGLRSNPSPQQRRPPRQPDSEPSPRDTRTLVTCSRATTAGASPIQASSSPMPSPPTSWPLSTTDSPGIGFLILSLLRRLSRSPGHGERTSTTSPVVGCLNTTRCACSASRDDARIRDFGP
jgi:coproporphyrinogen III oxidase-like Fe-S oxidoreductase